MKLDKFRGKCKKKVKFIYVPAKKEDETTWNIVVKEEFVDGIYNYYIGEAFVFGVEKRFTQKDLQNLYENGYFDLWLNVGA